MFVQVSIECPSTLYIILYTIVTISYIIHVSPWFGGFAWQINLANGVYIYMYVGMSMVVSSSVL